MTNQKKIHWPIVTYSIIDDVIDYLKIKPNQEQMRRRCLFKMGDEKKRRRSMKMEIGDKNGEHVQYLKSTHKRVYDWNFSKHCLLCLQTVDEINFRYVETFFFFSRFAFRFIHRKKKV